MSHVTETGLSSGHKSLDSTKQLKLTRLTRSRSAGYALCTVELCESVFKISPAHVLAIHSGKLHLL